MVVAATKENIVSHMAHLRKLAHGVSKTNEGLERATEAYYSSRKLLAELEMPARFAQRHRQDG
jgi:hypothetical protein